MGRILHPQALHSRGPPVNCSAAFPGPRGDRSGDMPPIPPKRGALIGLSLVLATLLGALAIGQAVWS